MEQKISLGEVTPAELNVLMKQLAQGQLAECMDLFIRFRQIGAAHHQAMQFAHAQREAAARAEEPNKD